ncbi:MAG: uracil-DNA glycosylase [Candidatus Omnitrophica bacterium]|nr:uracil-DNA glycosylase [Candidatus Omnitrophota bacterium]
MGELNQQISTCSKCSLGLTRTNAVVGEGDLSASVMFIGEAPGANEDAQGRPFCGKAGAQLDELLGHAGLKREEVFIGNILKCRPPKNRNPQSDEIIACTPYLDQQIERIRPSIICCLGNFATSYILKKFGLEAKVQGITKIHGSVFIAPASYGRVKIMPMFHPAVITYDMNKKSILAKDFLHLKNIPK